MIAVTTFGRMKANWRSQFVLIAAISISVLALGQPVVAQVRVAGNTAIPSPTIGRWLAEIGDRPVEEIACRLCEIYRRHGYYDAQVITHHDPSSPNEGVLCIDEGRPVMIGDITISCPSAFSGMIDQSMITSILTGIASRENIDQGLTRIVAELSGDGYPRACLVPQDFRRNGDRLSFALDIDPGPRARVDCWRITGLSRTDTAFVRKTLDLQVGVIWDRREKARVAKQAAELDYLLLAAEPRIIDSRDDALLTVEIPLVERPALIADGGLGLTAAEMGERGLRGRMRLTIENPFGRGRNLELMISRPSGQTSESRLNLADSRFAGSGVGLSLGLEQLRQASMYDRFSTRAGASLTASRRIRLGLEIGWMKITPLGDRADASPSRRYEVSLSARNAMAGLPAGGTDWQVTMTTSFRRTFQPRAAPAVPSSSRRIRLAASIEPRWTFGQGLDVHPLAAFAGWLGPDSDLSWGDEMYIGGPGTVRGYAERAFATRGHLLFATEVGYHPAGYIRFFGFGDLVYYRRFTSDGITDRLWRRVVGYGLGLETINYLGRTRVEIGWPEGASAGEGVIYLRWLRGW